jgi:hypothetical protein
MYASDRDGSDEIVLRAFDMQFRDDGLHAAQVFGLDLAPTLIALGADGDLASVLREEGDQYGDQQQQFCAYQMRLFCWGFGALFLGGAAYGFHVLFIDDDGVPGANDQANGGGSE